MILVEPSNDTNYVESVMNTKGMAELSGGKLDPQAIHEKAVDEHNVFFVALKNGERKGFVSFYNVGGGVAGIHVALKTRGQDTIDAVKQALAGIKALGISTVIAAFPQSRLAVARLADATGFREFGHANHEGEIFTVRKLTL